MNKSILKYILFTAIAFNINFSFAECNTDPELKLIKFEPSNLATYLPKESVVEEVVSDYSEYNEVTY